MQEILPAHLLLVKFRKENKIAYYPSLNSKATLSMSHKYSILLCSQKPNLCWNVCCKALKGLSFGNLTLSCFCSLRLFAPFLPPQAPSVPLEPLTFSHETALSQACPAPAIHCLGSASVDNLDTCQKSSGVALKITEAFVLLTVPTSRLSQYNRQQGNITYTSAVSFYSRCLPFDASKKEKKTHFVCSVKMLPISSHQILSDFRNATL